MCKSIEEDFFMNSGIGCDTVAVNFQDGTGCESHIKQDNSGTVYDVTFDGVGVATFYTAKKLQRYLLRLFEIYKCREITLQDCRNVAMSY